MFLVNSRQGPFTAPPQCSLRIKVTLGRTPSSEDTGLICEFLNEVSLARLGILYHPTCVGLRYGRFADLLRSFSRQCSINQSTLSEDAVSHHLSALPRRIFLPGLPTGLDHPNQRVADLAFCVPPSLKRQRTGTGILNLFPIAYAFRPLLRGRLTLGGRTFPRKPWDSGGPDSHRPYRYSCPHSHLCAVHGQFPSRFNLHTTLLYHSPANAGKSAASAVCLVPFIFGAKPLD